jgi:hypothetical protein
MGLLFSISGVSLNVKKKKNSEEKMKPTGFYYSN